MERYYLNYLKSITEDPLILKYIDMMKVEMDWRFYADGQELDPEYHWDQSLPLKWKVYFFVERVKSLLTTFNFPYLIEDYVFYSTIAHPVGYNNIIGGIPTLRKEKFLEKVIHRYPYNRILSSEVIDKLEEYELFLSNLFFNKNDFRALFLFTDQYYWTKQLISVFQKQSRPSFIFVHGLPPYYPFDADNKSDYLMVWGDRMKQNYIDGGFDANKIKVVGNFRYKEVEFHKNLRNSLDDVLVIMTSTKIYHQDTWNSNPTISDPSATLLYLYQIEHVLRNVGVSHARLRPHPSINKKWLKTIINSEFFTMDNESLPKSLQRSSLVIGPTSTVSMESIMNGVNYIVFEPCDENGLNFVNRPLAPPFDGSDPYLCVANNEEDLLCHIKEKNLSSSNLLKEYMQPFNPQIIKDLIK